MTVVFTTAHRTAKVTLTRDAHANGKLQLLTAANVVLAELTFTATAGTVSNGVWTGEFVASTVAAVASGTATKARTRNAAGTADIITDALTVGLTTGVPATEPDVIIQNTSINTGQNVVFGAFTFTEN